LPISLNGDKITALVVGGGPVGTRKALALSASGAVVKVVAPHVSAELIEAARNGELTIEKREYAGPSDIGASQVVFAATGSHEVNASVAADAHSLCRLVSVANAPTDGSFISMAVHRAGPVAIGVSAGNVPPAAGRIRDAIAARFDERYGDAVAACAELRSKVLAEQGSAGWAKIHPGLIGTDFCARVENGTFSEELAACRS
jgi:siroheme synthase-like protein